MLNRPQTPDARDTLNRRLDRLSRESQALDPRRTLLLARDLLARLDDHGVSYADFQAAQHAGKTIRATVRALATVL